MFVCDLFIFLLLLLIPDFVYTPEEMAPKRIVAKRPLPLGEKHSSFMYFVYRVNYIWVNPQTGADGGRVQGHIYIYIYVNVYIYNASSSSPIPIPILTHWHGRLGTSFYSWG